MSQQPTAQTAGTPAQVNQSRSTFSFVEFGLLLTMVAIVFVVIISVIHAA